MSRVMRIGKGYTKSPIENIIIRNKRRFENGKYRINNCIMHVKVKCRVMLDKRDKTCTKEAVLWYCIGWRDWIINRKQTESIRVKKEDNQQEKDGNDTGGDVRNGNGDDKSCREKYNSEQKQLILSTTELEDNIWTDIFQARAIDVSRVLISCRGQDLVMYIWDRRQIYCRWKVVISN